MTEKMNKLINFAAEIAREKNARFISSEHLLLAIFKLNDTASQFLCSYIKESDLEEKIFSGFNYSKVDGFSRDAEIVLNYSTQIAKNFSFKQVIPLHLVYAILDFKCENRAKNILYSLGVRISSMQEDLKTLFLSLNPKKIEDVNSKSKENKEESSKDKLDIDRLLIDLTQKARDNLISLAIGREEETKRIIQTLSKTSKNNPILLGDPGVGKTAIVENLAFKIINNNVPLNLLNKRLLSLDISSLIAGTQYRGQFEERMKTLIDYLKQENNNIILFIDEIHMIMGAGSSDGSSLDVANMLKPLLARSEISIIGATTFSEYRKYIEKDPALERRFMPIKILETSFEDTIKILEKLKNKFEKYHRVYISKEAIEKAVSLSIRYLPDRFLPDKAIDLLDETCSMVALKSNKIYQIDEIKERLNNLNVERLSYQKNYKLKEKLFDIENEIKSLEKTLINYTQAKEALNQQNMSIQAKDVANTIASWTGIKLESIDKEDKDRLRDLNVRLSKRLIGQDHAIDSVVKAIKRASFGFKDKNKPIGTFLFVGPTGVGKTELAKSLAKEMFGKEEDLIRIDMSEYSEKIALSRLIGASPGYVGYEEGGFLINQVRKKPFSIILFDEIEKAHPDIFNIFLQILEDGRLTDSQGKVADFKNTIIILTSNIGAKEIQEIIRDNTLTNDEIHKMYLESCKKNIKIEIINRLDEIVVFNNLDLKAFSKIAYLLITTLINNLKEQKIDLKIKVDAFNFIIKESYSIEFGARELRRKIQKLLTDKITDLILTGEIYSGSTIIVDKYKNLNELSFDIRNN